MDTFPSVDAMMVVLPEEDGPNSFDKSTRMMRMFPSTFISTFFMRASPGPIPGVESVGRAARIVNRGTCWERAGWRASAGARWAPASARHSCREAIQILEGPRTHLATHRRQGGPEDWRSQ